MNKTSVLKIMTVLALTTGSLAANAADGVGTSTAEIVAPITITPTQDLAFGRISANGGGKVVVNATTSARSVSSGNVALVSNGNTTTAASFTISGDGTSGFDITLPSSPITITHTNNTDTMSVGSFTSNPSNSSALVSGSKTIRVGAELTVGASQAAGVYSGNFTVTVEYN